MASAALRFGAHYVNLTEYVAETKEIMELAKDADTGLVYNQVLHQDLSMFLVRLCLKSFVQSTVWKRRTHWKCA